MCVITLIFQILFKLTFNISWYIFAQSLQDYIYTILFLGREK